MASIGIFFGTDTGKTRKIAKTIHKQLREAAAAPVNINRATLADLLAYPALLLGAPTLGDGQLSDFKAGDESESWAELTRSLGNVSLQGEAVALFGLGDQRGYPDNSANGLRLLYDAPRARGAMMIGSWPNKGYEFSASSALEGDRPVGLVLDQDNQFDETNVWLVTWFKEIKLYLL